MAVPVSYWVPKRVSWITILQLLQTKTEYNVLVSSRFILFMVGHPDRFTRPTTEHRGTETGVQEPARATVAESS